MHGARRVVGAARRCSTLRGLTWRWAGSRFGRRDDDGLQPVIGGKTPAARPIPAAMSPPLSAERRRALKLLASSSSAALMAAPDVLFCRQVR